MKKITTNLINWILLSTIIFTFTPASNSYAGEEELYDPEPPVGSAFIRAINANEKNNSANIAISDLVINSVSYPAASSYFVIKQGKYSVSSDDIEADIDVESGKYYSLIIRNDKIIKVEDAIIENPAKAMIYFYNFSDKKASLEAPIQKTSVFKDIKSGKNTSREINALTLDIAVTSVGKEVKTFKNIQLKRRRGTTFAITGSAGNYKAFATENEIEF